MAWDIIPQHNVGDLLAASDWNSVANDINNFLNPNQGTNLNSGYPVFCVGVAGSAPTASELTKIGHQASASYTPGGFQVTYPSAFPTGTDAVFVSSDLFGAPISSVIGTSYSASGFQVRFQKAAQSGGPPWIIECLSSDSVEFDWVAFGH